MNYIDSQIIFFLNQFAQQSWVLDKTITTIATNNLLKGGVLTTLIWWLWFNNRVENPHKREYIIAILFNSIVAIFVGRALALSLPFRPRPFINEEINFTIPHGVNPISWDGWSSFPSDHAVLFFSLSMGLFLLSKRVGIFALIYSTLIITLPRVYVGLHYPTDIIAGAIIGIIAVLIGNYLLFKSSYIQKVVEFSDSHPHYFYPLFFLLTYQISDMFDNSRSIVSAAGKFFSHLFQL